MLPWKSFWNKTILKPRYFWAGEALHAQTRGYINIALAQNWNSVIFQISAEKSFLAWQAKVFSCTYWMNLEVFLHDFCKLQPQKVYKNVQEFFVAPGSFFSAEIWKITEFHFWAIVLLRQPLVQASRASPAQKLWGLRVVYSKNFSRATFLVFWGTHLVDRYLR